MVSVFTAWGARWTGPHSPKTDSDRLIKDNRSRQLSIIRRSLSVLGLWGPVHRTPHAVITLTIDCDQQLHTAIIQYFSTLLSARYLVSVLRILLLMIKRTSHTGEKIFDWLLNSHCIQFFVTIVAASLAINCGRLMTPFSDHLLVKILPFNGGCCAEWRQLTESRTNGLVLEMGSTLTMRHIKTHVAVCNLFILLCCTLHAQ